MTEGSRLDGADQRPTARIVGMLPDHLGNGSLVPRGSEYPIFKDSGPKYHTLNGIWDQSAEILGTWTLCRSFLVGASMGGCQHAGPFSAFLEVHGKGDIDIDVDIDTDS